MKTTRPGVAVQNFLLTAFLLALFLTSTGCGSNYSGGGGGTSPSISGLSPASGAVGTAVTISGNYFGASQGSSTITFNGTAATPTSWSNTSIVAPVPAGATSGYVVVSVGGVASNGVTFTVSGSGGGSSAGWAFVQDTVITTCKSGTSSCNININIMPTTAGTVWILRIHTPNNVTITSVSGGGGSWQLCPASSCHLFDSSLTGGDNQDLAYNLSGTAGTTSVTVNLSGPAGSFFGGNFLEILPPPGSTASFDTAGTSTSSTCTTCAAPSLTLSGTDAVVQVLSGNGAAAWNSWSSPYMTDFAANGIGLNVSSGTGPTISVASPGGGDVTAIAFKSSAGVFTPPTGPISLVSYANPRNVNCAPSCSITVPSTGANHLLFLEAGDLSSTSISSVSGGGTWTTPSGANTCKISMAGGYAMSCAYVLASSAGATTINITMSGSASANFTFSEVSSSSGQFTFDTEASASNAAQFFPSGPSLTLSGTNDVVFQAAMIPGGASGQTWYPQPLDGFNWVFTNASFGILLNTAQAPAPLYDDLQNNATVVSGVAFKTP